MDKPYTKLKIFFLEHNIKHKDVAKLLKISHSRFSLKINRYKGADFTADEIRVICKNYTLNSEIFFN